MPASIELKQQTGNSRERQQADTVRSLPFAALFAHPAKRIHLLSLQGGSKEIVSKLTIRSEGPAVNRPGRKAGIKREEPMSAEGAAPEEFVNRPDAVFNRLSVAPSALISRSFLPRP